MSYLTLYLIEKILFDIVVETLIFCWLNFFLLDECAPLGFGAPRDPPTPNLPSSNPPELVALIGLGASLPPLPLKQYDKDPSIV